MTDIDFRQIAPRLGNQRDAFEELCCQIARRTIQDDATFIRLNGAGGDGGVECFSDLPDGQRVGWQAKYVFDVDSLLPQATNSITTALQIHPSLTRFVLCFPFDLTGPTGRKSQKGRTIRSGIEKINNWCAEHKENARSQGRDLDIEIWSASKLISLLVQFDVSGGIRKYFFDSQFFAQSWFTSHLQTAREMAGPRYHPELNVQTETGEWFAAFGRTQEWLYSFESYLSKVRKSHKEVIKAITRTSQDPSFPAWPDALRESGESISGKISQALDLCERIKNTYNSEVYEQCVKLLENVLSELRTIEEALINELDQEHGAGSAESPAFRQFMAEYQVSFPAANLDFVRGTIEEINEFCKWLKSPKGELAFHHAFLLSGDWGVGKTHGVCDIAFQRLNDQLFSCIAFGHQFVGSPDPWTRLTESLGLPLTVGKDELLDALNAAAEASGNVLILFIDAINETRPTQYWIDRISAIVREIGSRPNLKVCFTCRTPYLTQTIPEGHKLLIAEHQGFKGCEHVACKAFFNHYGLKPPMAPILQPELSNPLYLRLVCETLQSQGIDRLPTGWSSTAQVIAAFLEEKEKNFAQDKNTGLGARIVSRSLQRIAQRIAEKGQSSLSWSDAYRVIGEIQADAQDLRVVEWLIGANLLIEEATESSGIFPTESTVRPAFERFGDFLIALSLIGKIGNTPLESAFQSGGILHPFIQSKQSIAENYGVLSALSVLVPEQYPGKELPNLIESDENREDLLYPWLSSIPERDPSTFSPDSRAIIKEALANSDLNSVAIDKMLAVSWQPSEIDAIWLHELFEDLPLARRDAYWCVCLYESYEESRTIKRLIEASFDLSLEGLDTDIAERWSTVLLWMTAAADRRVKDWSTRALIRILSECTDIIPKILQRFLNLNDDTIRERLLLAIYGTLIVSRNASVAKQVTTILHSGFSSRPIDFCNALIRDHIRCISELAEALNALPEGFDPHLTMHPIASVWPLEMPTEEQIDAWSKLLRFRPDSFSSDFFKYSMGCLRPWEHAVTRLDMGKWILQTSARDLGYENSGCRYYDHDMLNKYGGGRAKPSWAERIGKKYQWIAMYQLASTLHDHVERKRDSWEPEPLRTPLILLEERKLDPTLFPANSDKALKESSWWITSHADLDPKQQLSDEQWVRRENDAPDLSDLLSKIQHNEQNWFVLSCHPSWDQRSGDTDENELSRHVWINVQSYLIKKEDFSTAYDGLHRRNFYGGWMPEGASLLYGFAGEYPWATSFNTEPEECYSRGGGSRDIPFSCKPSTNQLAIEWGYDATLPKNLYKQVPAREFFLLEDLWWNGQDGYRIINDKTVFFDPSILEAGPSSLLVDADDLIQRLDRLGLRIIWTLLGEKSILGSSFNEPSPIRTFSQIACLNEDGTIQVGDRVFFDDCGKDTGPKCL